MKTGCVYSLRWTRDTKICFFRQRELKLEKSSIFSNFLPLSVILPLESGGPPFNHYLSLLSKALKGFKPKRLNRSVLQTPISHRMRLFAAAINLFAQRLQGNQHLCIICLASTNLLRPSPSMSVSVPLAAKAPARFDVCVAVWTSIFWPAARHPGGPLHSDTPDLFLSLLSQGHSSLHSRSDPV